MADRDVLVVADASALPVSSRVWGTGGWLAPSDREALDWLTLVRLLGWDVDVGRVDATGHIEPAVDLGTRTVLLAHDPDRLDDETIDIVASLVTRGRMLVVSRAGATGSALAALAGASRTGGSCDVRQLEWRGPGPHQTWNFGAPFRTEALALEPDVVVWAAAGDAPCVVARRRGRGVFVTLAAHPSALRDADPSGTAVLRHLLIWGTPGSIAYLDFDHTMVLRMDDPGGAQNIYSREWSYRKLDVDAWDRIRRDLIARDARISLAYVAGWVDDGDAARGQVTIGGREVRRDPGAVHPSPLVRYHDVAGHLPGTIQDYESEFRGIQALRGAGRGDVELHGFTHMHPDTKAWARASDRFDTWPATAWFREFGPAAAPTLATLSAERHPLSRAWALFQEFFGIAPTTLICPGDQWTEATLERALDLGLQLVGSYYLAIRHRDRFCWTQHVCAPYLDEPASVWFASGLPVVGYFHDFEPAVHGTTWLATCLDRWQSAGARRVIDFRELASALALRLSLQADNGQLLVRATRVDGPSPVRPIPIRIRTEGPLPRSIRVRDHDRPDGASVEVVAAADGTGTADLPAASFHGVGISH